MKTPLNIRTRRGLLDVQLLIANSFDDTKPPSQTVLASWSKPRQADYHRAIKWLAENTVDAKLERDVAQAKLDNARMDETLKKHGIPVQTPMVSA